MLGSMQVVVAFLLALSLASERLVTIAKTAFPWLGDEKVDPQQQPDPRADRTRRLTVQALAFGACYLTAAVTTETRWPADVSKIGDYSMPLWGIALLTSGGSAFWSSILGYTKAAKDAQQTLQATRRLDLQMKSRDAALLLPSSTLASDTVRFTQ